MTEAIVSAVGKQLGELIYKQAEGQINLLIGVETEVHNLSKTLKKIQAVLADAERRQIREETVKAWLQDLENVSYEIDDVIDEWNYIVRKQEIEGPNWLTRLESLPNMIAGIWSSDSRLLLEATDQLRILLSIGESPPIEEVIQSGVVPRFVEFLKRENFPQLQFRVAAALANIAFGTSENKRVVIDHGAVPIFITLLGSPIDDVRRQAVRALGNIAADSSECRDLVLDHGAMMPLLLLLNEHTMFSILATATQTLFCFCTSKPLPQFEQVKPALPVLQRLIYSDYEEVLKYACWALSSLSQGTNDQIQAVIEAGVCQRLVELLLNPCASVVEAAVVTDGVQIQCIIDHGALPCLLSLLTHNHEMSIKIYTCWTISYITAGNKDQIQAVIEAGLIAPLVNLLQEAAWAIYNATYGGTLDQIKFLVSQGCIKPLCDLFVCPDPEIVTVCLEGLENILKVGEVEKNLENTGDVNYFIQLIDEAEGTEKIKNLQSHDNNEIYEKASKILEILHLMDSRFAKGF